MPRLPQQSPFNAFHEKLSTPEEIGALSIQMFVARLTNRTSPHLAARVPWNEAIAALDDVARSQGPPLEILADLAPMGSDVRKLPKGKARERRTTTLDDDNDNDNDSFNVRSTFKDK